MYSGISAPTEAWEPLGWNSVRYAEIDPFASAILERRHPNTPNVGDATTYDWTQHRGEVDLVVGGPPCQSFSLAGLRKSLDDARGNLSLNFVRSIHGIRPVWFVAENVDGWLSTHDNAFGCFLAGVVGADAPFSSGQPGGKWPRAGVVSGPIYGLAWRVLDAQFFGVPQRRERVFVVGHLGDWRPAAQVLFEPGGVSRDFATRGETREGVAQSLTSSTGGSSAKEQQHTFVGGKNHPLNALPIQDSRSAGATGQNGLGVNKEGDPAHTLDSRGQHTIAFGSKDSDPAATEDISPTLRAGQHHKSHPNAGVPPAVAYDMRGNGDGNNVALTGDHASRPTDYTPMVFEPDALGMVVRRLTPRECERLQGFKDDYTLIPWKSKRTRPKDYAETVDHLLAFGYDRDEAVRLAHTPDGPRYRVLGNSMAVPKVQWIGRRIQMVEDARGR